MLKLFTALVTESMSRTNRSCSCRTPENIEKWIEIYSFQMKVINVTMIIVTGYGHTTVGSCHTVHQVLMLILFVEL